MRISDRVSALTLSLALVGWNAAVCPGWVPTAEARMACCTDTETCPLHQRPNTSHHPDSSGDHAQTHANNCCALSEQRQSNPPGSTSAMELTNAVLGLGVVQSAPLPALVVSAGWRAAVPVPATPVPRHLLLSVFLV